MAKTFLEVQDEYKTFKQNFPDDPIGLGDFAKQVDQLQGVSDRVEAYNDAWYKKANAFVDRGFRATGLPEVSGAVTGGLASLVDSAAGTNIEPTVRRLGEDLPRMATEAVLSIPEAASGIGAPVAVATWANRLNRIRKILGYGGSALSGAATTDSPVLGAAISAGSLGLSNKLLLPAERGGVNVAEKAAGTIRDRLGIGGEKIVASEGANLASSTPRVAFSPDSVKNRLAVSGGVAAEAGTQLGINELTRQAQLSVGPNAVGLTDASRNPVTPENIAGNVVGLAPFAVHGALGVADASGFDARQAKPLGEWIKNRRQAVEADARTVTDGVAATDRQDVGLPTGTRSAEFDLKTEIEKPRFSLEDTAKLRQSIVSRLDAARSAESEGRTDVAEQHRAAAAEIMDKVGLGEVDITNLSQQLREVGDQARTGLAMATPESLAEFVRKVNSIIDFYNENRAKLAEGEITPEEVSFEKGTPKQSSHPEARDPSVVTRLQDKGLLPRITEDWLKQTYNATFDDLGNPKFATDVVGQQVANHLLDRVPEALRKETSLPTKATTEVSPNVREVDKIENKFWTSLQKFGNLPDVLNRLAEQTIRIKQMSNQIRGQQEFSRYSTWRKMVVLAAETFDPVGHTAMVYKNGKLQRLPISELTKPDLLPKPGWLKPGEGQKFRVQKEGKTISREENIQALAKGQENVGSTFDEDFDTIYKGAVEGEQFPGHTSLGESTTGGGKLEEFEIPEDVQSGLAGTFTKNAEKIVKVVGGLDDSQAWNLLRPVVTGGRATDVTFYQTHAKGIIEALPDLYKKREGVPSAAGLALVKAWTDSGKKLPGTPLSQVQNLLMGLLKSHVELPGVSKMTTSPRGDRIVANRAETAMGRAKMVVERLLNPKAIETAKGWKGPMAMAEKESPFPEGTTFRYTVQRSQNFHGAGIPGFVQVDAVSSKGERLGSFTLEQLREKGVSLPEVPESVKQGQYTLEQITAAGGKAKPMAEPATPFVGSGTEDLLVNHPVAGAFAPDILRTISAAVDKHFGAKGYSGDLRTMYHAAAMAVVNQMKDVPVDFYKISGDRVAGLANENLVPGRGQIGLRMEPTSFESSSHFVHRVLTALTHELAHIDDFVHFGQLRTPDAYSEERARQLTNLRSMYDVLSPDERKAILVTLDEGLTPPGYRTAVAENPTQLERGTQNVDEFSAMVMTVVTKSLLFGEPRKLRTALDVLDFSPVEIQEYAQFQFRTIRDVFQALTDTLADPSIRAQAGKPTIATGDPYVLSRAFGAVLASATEASRVRDGTKEVALAREMVKAMSSGAGATTPVTATEATWYRRQRKIETDFGRMVKASSLEMANMREGMDIAREALGISYDTKHKPGVWSNWFAPFTNLMDSMERSGVELAKPLANLLMDTESAIRRLHSDIMSPLLKRQKDGTVKYDDDQAFIKGMSPRVRAGFNEVSRWQESHGGRPMFNEVNGELVPITEARAEWESMKKRFSPADQQAIVAGSVAWDRIGQNEAKAIMSTLVESTKYRIAGMLMATNKGMMYEPAMAQAEAVTNAFFSRQVQSLAGTIPPAMLQRLGVFFDGPQGVIASFDQLKAKFDAAPGYRTTQLPHDWVVMYKKDGKVKFTSAPTEKQAYYARDRIVQQDGEQVGEIVNRKTLRGKFAEFDDPDTVLLKFAKVENDAWQRVVEQVRVTDGEEVAERFAGMFTPGLESLGDRERQTFQKYITERKGLVDTENLDFLDAGLARATRLSASIAYKLHGQLKDLVLNDPRARMFPSFRDRVNKQWDNIVTPIGHMTQQIRTMGSAYFLGLNLSSMAVEGTQSLTTVLPMLVGTNQKGGVVKAVAQLGRAIGRSAETNGNGWQVMGKAAFDAMERGVRDGVEPKLTADELRWGMYYRAVQNGDIGHAVISDMGYSRGLKAQELVKFGEGDYGPTPWGKFVTDKLYNTAQAMLGFYGTLSKFNEKIAFLAGVDQGLEMGLKGDDLYYHAKKFKTMTTFGGGKANAAGITQAKDPHLRSGLALATTLQSYGLGMVSNYIKFAKESINADKSLSPMERRQAVKGLMTMLAVQTSVAGVLGLPFAGAAMVLVEKATGTPVQQLVREGLASLADDEDGQNGGWFAETVMNGLGNQMFGMDVSSRLGVSSILGTSSYRGFSIADMAGPFPSIAENVLRGLNYFGQKDPIRAGREMVPTAFKNVLAMADSRAKYGDYAIRDRSENLVYTPSEGQNIWRAVGFRPREESQRRLAEGLIRTADERMQGVQDREYDSAARRLLSGDSLATRQFARDVAQSGKADERDVLRSVMERAVRMTQEKDLLASGARAGVDERRKILSTFGPGVNTRQSEMQLVRLRMQLAQQLGSPELMPQDDAWARAAVVDGLVAKTGMARSQALATTATMGL